MKALSILLSAVFTGLTAQALGLLLIQRLRPRFTREEQYAYGFVAGSAVLSLIVFAIAAAQLVWTASFVVVGVAAIGGCWYRRAYVPFDSRFEPIPRFYRALLTVSMLAFGAFYFMNALAPEVSPDGTSYHLGLVQRFIDQRGFGRITTTMYANVTLGVEMLFLFAFSLGRHSAAALVHFLFLVAMPLVMTTAGRRFGLARAGVTAGLLVYLSPVFGIDGSTAYIDVAMSCAVFSLFAILQIWDETRETGLLVLAGLLAGFAYAAKMTAGVAIPYAIGFVLYKLICRRQPIAAPLALLCGCIGLMAVPWLVKNVITVGNPISPFGNRLFPNPYVRIAFEDTYRQLMRTYEGLGSPWNIPLELTVRGKILNGLLGPVFLLAPVGLLSLRWRFGRQVALAALVFASTYPGNVGTRFLIAAAPFVAFAIAMTLAHWRAMAPAVVLFHALLSWPRVIPVYSDEYAWRIDRLHWRAALRLQPEAEFIASRTDGFGAGKLVERFVPKDGKVFTFGGIAQAYCRRDVVVAYESALGNMLGDFIGFGFATTYQPARFWTYPFPKQRLRRLRLVQTVKSNEVWSASEIRLLGPDGEVERRPKWRVRAHPNPWEVQLAFDNCPVTRWSASESSNAGQFVEMGLDRPVELIGVRVEATLDQADGTARLETEGGSGWKTLVEKPVISDAPPLSNPRRLGIEELKRYGFVYLHVHEGEFFAADMAEKPAVWGVTLLGESGPNRLYRLD